MLVRYIGDAIRVSGITHPGTKGDERFSMTRRTAASTLKHSAAYEAPVGHPTRIGYRGGAGCALERFGSRDLAKPGPRDRWAIGLRGRGAAQRGTGRGGIGAST